MVFLTPRGRCLVFVAIISTESLSWSGFAVREGSPQRGGSILCSLHATLLCPAYDLFNFLVRQSNSLLGKATRFLTQFFHESLNCRRKKFVVKIFSYGLLAYENILTRCMNTKISRFTVLISTGSDPYCLPADTENGLKDKVTLPGGFTNSRV